MMAIIETGGKQYKVEPGSVIRVEKLNIPEGKEVILDKVLMIKEEDKSFWGNPLISKAKVIAEVLREGKDRKIIVYKFKRRKGYKRKYGHRQRFSELLIKEIQYSKKPEKT
ncbi:50S ribosomal protein L21 [Candidatus Aerophobetes bacterium]|nr:50S ribosomal protein L21 [Candidatus Aerophobetes bacterium]